MATTANTGSVEDFAKKRQLLLYYKSIFEQELERPDLSAAQVTKLRNDIALLSQIDEDLIRFNAIPMRIDPKDRHAAAELRSRIVSFIARSPAPVRIGEICTEFDLAAHQVRNILRRARLEGTISYDDEKGYRVLVKMPAPAPMPLEPRRLS